jgi:hypothetical protein
MAIPASTVRIVPKNYAAIEKTIRIQRTVVMATAGAMRRADSWIRGAIVKNNEITPNNK